MIQKKVFSLYSKCVLLLCLTQNANAFSPEPSQQYRQRINPSSLTTTSNRRTSSTILNAINNNEKNETTTIMTTTNRRSFLTSSALLTTTALLPPNSAFASPSSALAVPTPSLNNNEMSWPLGKVAFSLLPLAGTSTRRATIQETVVPDQIWTMDQIQGIVNVNVPVRQTVIKLSPQAGGGLWVHNPLAPTPQLLKMMRQLEQQHGPVRHIVLGSVALEHKATFGAFARQFPKATVWIQPGQWSFPLNLPIDVLGVTQRGAQLREIPVPNMPVTSRLYENFAKQNPVPEWGSDFEWETLGPLRFRSVGAFSETAFFHKSTKSLLVTDAVISITKNPPSIITEDPRALLFHARDSIDDVVVDSPETRQKGWRRMVQFGLVFFPSQINVETSVGTALSKASKIDVSMKNLGDGAVPLSLYPWSWNKDNADIVNFDAISQGGRLLCPPILTKLILDREPQRTLEWADRVATRFDFERIIPSHMNNDVRATPREFRAAFDLLQSAPDNIIPQQRPLAADLALLQKASDLLTDLGVVSPSQVCDGELARSVGRFAR